MKLKMNQDGSAVVRDGKPVYIMSNGTERPIDGAAAFKLAVGKHFEGSPVMDTLNLPHDVVAAYFGDSFDIQGGKLVALDKHGMPTLSLTRYGETADFDEGFERLVAAYPNKAKILREPANTAAAPGQKPGAGGTIDRAQLDAMHPAERGKFFQNGGKLVDALSAAAPAPASVPQGAKTISRAQFDAMPQPDRHTFFGNGGKISD